MGFEQGCEDKIGLRHRRDQVPEVLGRGLEDGIEGGIVCGVESFGEGNGNLGIQSETFIKVFLDGIGNNP